MTIASDLLQRHIQTLVDDNAQWQTLISDDILWELAYAPALGHPARISGRAEVMRHVTWFLSAVENFRFFDPKVYPFADPQSAVAQVRAEGIIKILGAFIAKNTWCSSVLRRVRSCSFANISLLLARPRRSICPFSISNLGDKRQL